MSLKISVLCLAITLTHRNRFWWTLAQTIFPKTYPRKRPLVHYSFGDRTLILQCPSCRIQMVNVLHNPGTWHNNIYIVQLHVRMKNHWPIECMRRTKNTSLPSPCYTVSHWDISPPLEARQFSMVPYENVKMVTKQVGLLFLYIVTGFLFT